MRPAWQTRFFAKVGQVAITPTRWHALSGRSSRPVPPLLTRFKRFRWNMLCSRQVTEINRRNEQIRFQQQLLRADSEELRAALSNNHTLPTNGPAAGSLGASPQVGQRVRGVRNPQKQVTPQPKARDQFPLRLASLIAEEPRASIINMIDSLAQTEQYPWIDGCFSTQ